MPTSCWKIWEYLPSLANIILLLPSANVVWDGYVFTPVCHSVHRGTLPQCMLGYTPPSRQTPLRWTPPWADTPSLPSTCRDTHTPSQCMLGYTVPSACWDRHGYCCRWYASYWNASLLVSTYIVCERLSVMH